MDLADVTHLDMIVSKQMFVYLEEELAEMKDTAFPVALWSSTWDGILNDIKNCEQGEVSYTKNNGIELDVPFGQLLGNSDELVIGKEQYPNRLTWLYGFSQTGQWLALNEVVEGVTQSSAPGGVHQRLHCSRLLCGRDRFEPSSPVRYIELTIEGLSEWLGKSPISQQRRYEGNRLRNFTINVNLDKEGNVTLLDDNQRRISIFHRVTQKNGTTISIEHRCTIQAEFKRPVSLESAEDVALRLADFFSFCFGFHAEPSKITVKFTEDTSAELVIPCVKGKVPTFIDGNRMPFPYQRIETDIDTMLSRWLDDDSLVGPSSLLVSTIFKEWQVPVDLRFIAAAQLLEALSRVNADLESMSSEEFEAYKSTVMKALDSIEDDEVRKKARSRINLRNEKGQSRLMRELLNRHEQISNYMFRDIRAYTDKHIELRNDITHRNEKTAFESKGLFWHTEGTLLLAYGIVAELLGLEPATVIDGIRESAFKWRVPEWTRSVYRSN